MSVQIYILDPDENSRGGPRKPDQNADDRRAVGVQACSTMNRPHEQQRPNPSGSRLWLPMAVLGALLALLLVFGALPAAGAEATAGVDPSVVAIPGVDARRFADPFFDRAQEDYPHVGAAIAIVHDGALVCAGGYGRYGIDDDRPVDAERTLFGAGSIGKLITWTAVMQLVERGLLDLDTDVNEYLTTFSIPATFDEPITLRHLMTHTQGFDDTAIGSVTQYSNYGAALAGYIVAVTSGSDFHAYVESEILAPLGMEQSSFRQPLPPALARDATPGHAITPAGTVAAVPHVFGEIYPAGTGYFTAIDLARFMIAHLDSGPPILRTEAARTMHARAFSNDPRLPGMALGFIEGETNGIRTLWHTGTSPAGSHGILVLIPSTRTGVVMLANTVNTSLSRALVGEFFDAFYPRPTAEADGSDGPVVTAGLPSPAGRYRQNWYAHHGIEKIDSVKLETRITETREGAIRARFEDGLSRDYVAIAPDFYRDVESDALLMVERDADGRVVRLYRGDRPIVGAIARRITRRERPAWTGRDRVARSLGVATGWLGIVFFAGYASILVLAGTTSILRSPLAVIVFNLPALLILLAAALAWFAWQWNVLGYMG